jgi:hypothetical protein
MTNVNIICLSIVQIIVDVAFNVAGLCLAAVFLKFTFTSFSRYVPPITTSSDGHGGSVALPESPDAIEEEIKKQESLLAGDESRRNFKTFESKVSLICTKLNSS